MPSTTRTTTTNGSSSSSLPRKVSASSLATGSYNNNNNESIRRRRSDQQQQQQQQSIKVATVTTRNKSSANNNNKKKRKSTSIKTATTVWHDAVSAADIVVPQDYHPSPMELSPPLSIHGVGVSGGGVEAAIANDRSNNINHHQISQQLQQLNNEGTGGGGGVLSPAFSERSDDEEYYSIDPLWEMSNTCTSNSTEEEDQELVDIVAAQQQPRQQQQQRHHANSTSAAAATAAAAAVMITGSPESSITSPYDDDDDDDIDLIYSTTNFSTVIGSDNEDTTTNYNNDRFLGINTFNNNNSHQKKSGNNIIYTSTNNNNAANNTILNIATSDDDDTDDHDHNDNRDNNVFIAPEDIHPSMEQCNQQDIEQLRLLAGKLSVDWRTGSGPDGTTMAAPALARRIRDFQFAQEKRRKKYGDERPWGILGLYDFLSSIRIDVEWAEDAARRRANGEPYLSWADFDESKKSGRNRPFFTYILLAVCTIMLIASIAVNGWKVEPLDENPMIGPSAETLIKMGAKDTYLIVNEDEGWRLLSSTVLHAGLVHYFINMLALWFVGGAIETSHGWIAAMIIFLISAVGGTILSALFLPEYITVGASGGIFGFIGACLADIIMNWKLLFCDFVTAENGKKQSHIMVVVILVVDILLNSIIGLTPYVDNFTHLGGMVYGFLCGISTMQRLSTDFFGMEEGFTTRAKHFFMRFFGIILSIISIVVTLVVLLHGDGETTLCPNCTWLSCVTFPPWEDYDSKWWYCDNCGKVTADIVTQPYLHLDLQCPTEGNIVTIDISDEDDVSRTILIKKLPSYCREYCLFNNVPQTIKSNFTNSTTDEGLTNSTKGQG